MKIKNVTFFTDSIKVILFFSQQFFFLSALYLLTNIYKIDMYNRKIKEQKDPSTGPN